MHYRKIWGLIFILACVAHTQTLAYDPYKHTTSAMTTLKVWSIGSMVVGTGMLFIPDTQVKYAGIQNIAWGAIDLGIAFWGEKSMLKNIGYKPPDVHQKEFRTALWINGLLDIAYMGVGYYLYRHGQNDKLKGTGAGIFVQGSFLFVFDWVNFAIAF